MLASDIHVEKILQQAKTDVSEACIKYVYPVYIKGYLYLLYEDLRRDYT